MDCDELLIDLMCENNEEAHTIFRKRYMSFVRMWVMGYKNIVSPTIEEIEEADRAAREAVKRLTGNI